MSSNIDNPPAFPQHIGFNPNNEAVTAGMYFAEGPGMSLRDYFAAKAIGGMLQREHAFAFLDDDPSSGHTVAGTTSNYARAAYNIADAMLAERAKAKP